MSLWHGDSVLLAIYGETGSHFLLYSTEMSLQKGSLQHSAPEYSPFRRAISRARVRPCSRSISKRPRCQAMHLSTAEYYNADTDSMKYYVRHCGSFMVVDPKAVDRARTPKALCQF